MDYIVKNVNIVPKEYDSILLALKLEDEDGCALNTPFYLRENIIETLIRKKGYDINDFCDYHIVEFFENAKLSGIIVEKSKGDIIYCNEIGQHVFDDNGYHRYSNENDVGKSFIVPYNGLFVENNEIGVYDSIENSLDINFDKESVRYVKEDLLRIAETKAKIANIKKSDFKL